MTPAPADEPTWRRRLLVVEDEPLAANLLRSALDGRSFDVETARSVADARAWDGLCAVTWAIDDAALAAIDADATITSAVGDICTEACSNAVRHGAATIVEIAATTGADRLHLRIANDGAHPGERRGGGLGSAMLDAVALDWQRGRVDGRTVLAVELALEPAAVPA